MYSTVHMSISELTGTIERGFGEISSKFRELETRTGVLDAASSLQSGKSTWYLGWVLAVSSLSHSCVR